MGAVFIVHIATFCWIITITIACTIVLLHIILNGLARIKPVAWGTISIYTISAYALIIIITSWMIKQMVWGTVDSIFFTIASISVSVLTRVINKRMDRRAEDLGVAVAKLHMMQTSLCHLHQIQFTKQCNSWLNSVENLQIKEKDIKVRYDGCGLNYLKRFVISWQADQMLNIANGLLKLGDNLLHPKDQLRGTTNFYKKVVIDFIEDMGGNSGLLGIWGMGGVGKTSLLKLMVGDSRSEYDNDSFEVLFVRAGIGCTVGQLQEAIATSMGLCLERNETSQAKVINDHLKDTSFLFLLDDLWGYLDLKAVGIPSPLGTVQLSQGRVVRQKWRKVVLTSRNMELCGIMGCSHDNTIQMECFDEENAWALYHRGWPVAISKVDVFDKSPEILPLQTSSSSSHSERQLLTIQPQTVGSVQPKRPQVDMLGMMANHEKVCYFIDDDGTQSQLLGVCGMRGVGKTALLRLVRDSYTGNSYFDHVITVGAGTGSVVNNVQHAVAINLGLDLAMLSSLDELSRAMHIFNYLKHKSFLLLLDDIREPLNWWAVGVPILSHRRQKIIFAARSQAACALMGCHAANIIEMQCLGKDDARSLFRDKVGLGIIDDHQVHHLAEQMVLQCGGLPLALCALGRAMSNRKDPREWRGVYSQLIAMRSEPFEIDEKLVSSILGLYGWREDNSSTAKQIQANTNFVYEQKQATLTPGVAKSTINQISPSRATRRIHGAFGDTDI